MRCRSFRSSRPRRSCRQNDPKHCGAGCKPAAGWQPAFRFHIMKILSRYVFREILTSSFLATALATFVIFLQGIGKLFELLVRSAKGPAVLELFVLSLPPILLLSIPFGVLVGILVRLGRLSSDNEVIAMRSAGVSSRIIVAPVLTFAAGAMLLTGACAVWLNPLAIRAQFRILNTIAAAQLTA